MIFDLDLNASRVYIFFEAFFFCWAIIAMGGIIGGIIGLFLEESNLCIMYGYIIGFVVSFIFLGYSFSEIEHFNKKCHTY